jgi:hypothetical protein
MSRDQAQPTDVLDSKRYLVKDLRGRNLYVTVADDPVVGTPVELWITMPDENKQSEQVLKTDILTIATLFSEARDAGAKYTKLLSAMERVCYSKASIPYQIIEILKIHCPVEEAKSLEFEFASQKQAEAFDDGKLQ